MAHSSTEVEAVMTKLRASLKRRGAEGIRGLGRHFKVRKTDPTMTTAPPLTRNTLIADL